jgi:hypothetical protein
VGRHHHAPGGAGEGIAALTKLGQEYPKARLALCGFGTGGKNLAERLAEAGIGAAHTNKIVSQSRTTAEDALYSAALLKPKPIERWLLITAALHMPRAVGWFRAPGLQVASYPVEFATRGRSGPLALFATGSSALVRWGCEGVNRPRRLPADGQLTPFFRGHKRTNGCRTTCPSAWRQIGDLAIPVPTFSPTFPI